MIFDLKKKAKLGTFMSYMIVELRRMFLIPTWPNGVRSTLGPDKKALLFVRKASSEICWFDRPTPAPDHYSHPPEASAGSFQSYSLCKWEVISV